MGVITKTDAKKFLELEDRMIDILDYLLAKNIMNSEEHRGILLRRIRCLCGKHCPRTKGSH